MAEISVLICTLNDRIKNVPRILLPESDEVNYIVAFQYTDQMFYEMIPEEIQKRNDVTIYPSSEVGLCANRNNALRNCKTQFAVIADDDTVYSKDLLNEVVAKFRINTELDIISFAHNRLALRLSPNLPQFDTRFGIGSSFLSCGEEEVFVHQAEKLGLRVQTVRFTSYSSESVPWAQLSQDKRMRRSWGALQYMKHSTTVAFLQITLKSISLHIPERTVSRWQIFRDLLDGLRYIISHPLNDSIAEEIPLDFQPIDVWRMP